MNGFVPDGITTNGDQMYSLTEEAWQEMTAKPDCMLPCFFRRECAKYDTCVDQLNG